VTVSQRKITDPHLLDRVTQTLKDGVLDQTLVDKARSDFINTVWYQDTFSPPPGGLAAAGVALAMALSGEFASIAGTIGGIFSGWFGAAVTALIAADLLAGWAVLPAVPRQPLMWYRDDWPGPTAADNGAKVAAMQEDLYDRQEIYNENFRQWHWRICMECIGYTFDDLVPAIKKRLQLMVGTSDNYPMVHFADNVPQFAAGLSCPGNAKSIYDTGHSIHNERPYFLAQEVMNFTGPPQHGFGLLPVWMSPSPLTAPDGSEWFRGIDAFVAADVDGDGHAEVVIYNNADLWTGVLKWQDGALVPVWMSPSPLHGPAGNWDRGVDGFVAADVDGDHQIEVVIFNDIDRWTGLLKWQDGALSPLWMTPTPLGGPAGDWDRGMDAFVAADVDGDGHAEVIIYNNADLWTGVLQWNPLLP
jgi:hypothetical protein